ncbi:TonB-linked SusC/RagA family outer membrane protein [Christiangramia gaetbulicola]|uniref:TonB-linked SusC/RagA family outer membrane protein n=1 Tax=Christiangramia gaetbulicola TaxID=703340 RepID=A0A2T6ALR2_9FLAO|nr:SusC/RagA family TonB-linked outer membrane protein [Christiangramia gaetbulicola]PTX44717.1 TonB-linked SusC/RagA family outer membrane protein [Christiangramia gaetbulicola]
MKQFSLSYFKVIFFLLCPSLLLSQEVLEGTTINEATGEVVPFVNVLEKGTSNGTTSDIEGKFSITVESLPTTLVFSYLGFETQERNFTDDSPITIRLSESAAALDEVVVTGLASSTKRSNTANAVASVSAEELTGVTVQSGLDGALSGKFNGAEIKANSGAPGGGISMRLRGVTSIFGDQQPLFIVDGVYVDNSSIGLGNNIVSEAAGGGNPSTNQDDASNRIADIDPQDIESVEILKGASAAAIYGSRAAGGVVLITTKRGKMGLPKVTFSQVVGLRTPTQLLGLRDYTQEQITALGGPNNPTLNDYEAELFDNTVVSSTTRFSTSGANEKTDYFFGATHRNEPGLVDNTGYKKSSVRLNIGQKFNDWLDLYVTSNYINSQSDRGFFNNGNANRTVGYALAFTYPWEDLYPVDGIYPFGGAGSNVLETVALTTNREEVNRFIGSAKTNVKLLTTDRQRLKLVLEGGFDQYTLRTTSIFPSELTYFRDPSSLGGVSISGSTVNTNYNLSAFLVHNLDLDNGLAFTTQAGSFLQDFNRNTVITIATGLNGSQTNLGQSTNVSTNQVIRPQRDKGFFVQEEVNFDDKIIGTVGIRGDKSTNNGDANEMYYYPKANLAVNLHEFDFWNLDFLNVFKPRIAYGEAGRFPNFNDRFSLMDAQFIDGSSGLSPANLRGNSNIGPERQKELEYGLDFALFDKRLDFSVSFYDKTIEDLLIQSQFPTSSGFTTEVVNGGELQNKGVELGLNAIVMEKDEFSWNASFKWWKNKSEVTSLDVPSFTNGGFAAGLGTFLIQEGKSATQIVGTYDADAFTAEEIAERDPEGDGFFVYGNAEPDFQMSWYNEIKFGNFDFTFLWHWKKGGDNINLTTLLYDLAGTTWDYNDTDLDPSGQLSNGQYRASQAFVNPGPFIEDAGYLKLREVGLFYTLPNNFIKYASNIKVGVSGRNLINIFDYNSYDPEVSNFGNNVLANNVEVTPYPMSRFVNFHLNVNF